MLLNPVKKKKKNHKIDYFLFPHNFLQKLVQTNYTKSNAPKITVNPNAKNSNKKKKRRKIKLEIGEEKRDAKGAEKNQNLIASHAKTNPFLPHKTEISLRPI